jgi:hypothetical protein
MDALKQWATIISVTSANLPREQQILLETVDGSNQIVVSS